MSEPAATVGWVLLGYVIAALSGALVGFVIGAAAGLALR